MRPMLDDLELPQVQEVTSQDWRFLAEHKPPGMDGSFFQNMGRRSACVDLWGVTTGPEALNFVEKLDGKFRDGKPVPFVTDISTAVRLDKVLIEELDIREVAGKPERFAYRLTLVEFIEPLEPTQMAPVQTQVLAEAEEQTSEQIANITSDQGILEVLVELAEDQDFSGIRVLVEGNTSTGETLSTYSDEQTDGLYRFADIPAGTYDVRLEMT